MNIILFICFDIQFLRNFIMNSNEHQILRNEIEFEYESFREFFQTFHIKINVNTFVNLMLMFDTLLQQTIILTCFYFSHVSQSKYDQNRHKIFKCFSIYVHISKHFSYRLFNRFCTSRFAKCLTRQFQIMFFNCVISKRMNYVKKRILLIFINWFSSNSFYFHFFDDFSRNFSNLNDLF